MFFVNFTLNQKTQIFLLDNHHLKFFLCFLVFFKNPFLLLILYRLLHLLIFTLNPFFTFVFPLLSIFFVFSFFLLSITQKFLFQTFEIFYLIINLLGFIHLKLKYWPSDFLIFLYCLHFSNIY